MRLASSGVGSALAFRWFAQFAGVDVPTSSAKARALLGWAPKEKGLIEDLDQPCYFNT